MKSRIKNITPTCDYRLEGISEIRLLDFEDFEGFRFDGDQLYDTCLITGIGIKPHGEFKEVYVSTSAKYNSSIQDGAYTHTVETFVNDLSAELEATLYLAIKKRFIPVFKTKTGRMFTFGYEAGATVTYTDQTSESLGSLLTIKATSKYPLFEIAETGLENRIIHPEFIPDFKNGAFCEKTFQNKSNNGYLQATIAYKQFQGEPVDIDGNLTRISGKKQAIALLRGYMNPDPGRYETDIMFDPKEPIGDAETYIYAPEACPINYIYINPKEMLLYPEKSTCDFVLESFHPWRLISQPKNVQFNLKNGNGGIHTIRATRSTSVYTEEVHRFENIITGDQAAISVKNNKHHPEYVPPRGKIMLDVLLYIDGQNIDDDWGALLDENVGFYGQIKIFQA